MSLHKIRNTGMKYTVSLKPLPPYSHHRVALFGKKASQERVASRISAFLDITLNDDDGLLNLRCAKCKQSLETVMIDLTKFNFKSSRCCNPNFHSTPL